MKPGAELNKRRFILKLDFLMSSNLFKHIKDDLLIDIKGRNAYFYPEFKIISTLEFFARALPAEGALRVNRGLTDSWGFSLGQAARGGAAATLAAPISVCPPVPPCPRSPFPC